MIKYDNKYYNEVIKKYNYDEIKPFLDITDESLNNKWICSYNLNDFVKGLEKNEKCIVIMGIGINGIPHIGTVSQILKAIYLQKKGFFVQIILGDLDVYGARSTPLAEINKFLKKYENFIISLGFDINKGIIRNQYDHPEILRTSFLLSTVIKDKDFEEIEEDINSLYKTERVYGGMDFNVKQSISLMFADFIHPCLFEDFKHVLIISGIDEHGYVWKADEIRKRLNIDMTISGLYSKMLRGLNNYPKMSKSIIKSNINLSINKKELEKIILLEGFLYNNHDDSFVYQLMQNVSFYDNDYLKKVKANCDLKNEEWIKNVKKYIDDLYEICNLWR